MIKGGFLRHLRARNVRNSYVFCARSETLPHVWRSAAAVAADRSAPPIALPSRASRRPSRPFRSTSQRFECRTARNGRRRDAAIRFTEFQLNRRTPERKRNDNPDQERWERVKEQASRRSRRRNFPELVRPHGPGADRGRHGASVGADALPQELDPVALHRARCWPAGRREHAEIQKLDVSVRSAVIRTALPKAKQPEPIELGRDPRGHGSTSAKLRAAFGPVSSGHDALGGSPLDLRLTFDTLRGRPLQHAGARRRQAGGGGAPRRSGDVQSALHPRRRRARQDAPAPGDHLGRQQRLRAQGALSHRRKVHVRLRLGAAHPDRARVQGGAARHRRAGDRRPAVPAGQVDPGRVLPHAQRADRRRPPGGDRRRPPADRSRKPRRSRALAAGRRAGGRDGAARRGAAARDPENPRRRGAAVSSELRRAGAGARPISPRPSPTTAAISKARSTACSPTTSSPASR